MIDKKNRLTDVVIGTCGAFFTSDELSKGNLGLHDANLESYKLMSLPGLLFIN